MTDQMTILNDLPGEALVRQGLADLAAQRRTISACLVSMASPRLRRAGLLSVSAPIINDAELSLYGLLRAEAGDAYSRYNSFLRELVSFERALDRRLRSVADRKRAVVN
jgi:hypothetical protein